MREVRNEGSSAAVPSFFVAPRRTEPESESSVVVIVDENSEL